MTSLEYVRNQIIKLKDDLQHYTMVEKDSALASQIRYDLEQFVIIEKELKALEIIKRNPILIIRLLTNNATYKYVVDVTNESERPTQEEWNLLKEVLL